MWGAPAEKHKLMVERIILQKEIKVFFFFFFTKRGVTVKWQSKYSKILQQYVNLNPRPFLIVVTEQQDSLNQDKEDFLNKGSPLYS